MAVIDDTVLDSLLQSAGDSFALPVDGVADILRRAAGGNTVNAEGEPSALDPADEDEGLPAGRRWSQAVRTHRLLSVAAAVVVLGAVTGTALSFGSGGGNANRTVNSLQQAGGVTLQRSGTVTTTTSSGLGTPASGGAENDTQFNALAPSAAAAPAVPGASSGTTGAIPSGTASAGSGSSPALPSGVVGQSAKVEQTGSLTLTVAKGTLSTAMAKLSYLATAANGFVANSQTQSGAGSGGPPSGTITLQVPVASFASVLKGAQSLGKTSQLTTKATDVTGQYVDLQARITALQDSRQQYLTIMAKATSIGDVLAVQAQLDTLQEQIEQLQGQLQVLDSETAYSTLTITVNEKASKGHTTPAKHTTSSLQKAWHASIHGFTDGVDGLIRLAGPVLFALLCLAVVVLGGRVLWRRVQRHNL